MGLEGIRKCRVGWELSRQDSSAENRSLLLATAAPVQLYPIEAWDLLDVLSRGDPSVFGNMYGPWRKPGHALALVMGDVELPSDLTEQWEWVRNPLPPKEEHPDFEILRRRLGIEDREESGCLKRVKA
jgi:hypothetical protein